MRKLLALTCVLALALTVAGCGASGGSESSDDDPTTTEANVATTTTATTGDDNDDTDDEVGSSAEDYEAAIVISLTSGRVDEGDLVLPQEAAECVAPKFVEVMTLELLRENVSIEDASTPGFDPSDVGIDEAQAQEVIDVFGACDFDIYVELALGITGGLGEELQTCAAENIDPELADALMVKSFSSGESDAEFEALLAALAASCPGLPTD